MILNYNIPFLNTIFEKALFVYIKRDPVCNVASILDARKRQLGSENKWYSFKIPEYSQLKDLDPIRQSAGQVNYINSAVTKGLSTIANSRKMVVQYEEFCQNPKLIFDQLVSKLNISDSKYLGQEQFELTRTRDFPKRLAIENALAYFESRG
jgi:hypothetical protein